MNVQGNKAWNHVKQLCHKPFSITCTFHAVVKTGGVLAFRCNDFELRHILLNVSHGLRSNGMRFFCNANGPRVCSKLHKSQLWNVNFRGPMTEKKWERMSESLWATISAILFTRITPSTRNHFISAHFNYLHLYLNLFKSLLKSL